MSLAFLFYNMRYLNKNKPAIDSIPSTMKNTLKLNSSVLYVHPLRISLSGKVNPAPTEVKSDEMMYAINVQFIINSILHPVLPQPQIQASPQYQFLPHQG